MSGGGLLGIYLYDIRLYKSKGVSEVDLDGLGQYSTHLFSSHNMDLGDSGRQTGVLVSER